MIKSRHTQRKAQRIPRIFELVENGQWKEAKELSRGIPWRDLSMYSRGPQGLPGYSDIIVADRLKGINQ